MTDTQALLENHIIYGLDKVICDYLAPILEQKLGEPFRLWCFRVEEQSRLNADATRVHGKTVVGQPVEYQEELLAYGDGGTRLDQAWHDLMDTAAWLKWRELYMLYDCADEERRDLEHMAVAQQAAEESGDKAHAERVREIMALEHIQSPAWWQLK